MRDLKERIQFKTYSFHFITFQSVTKKYYISIIFLLYIFQEIKNI